MMSKRLALSSFLTHVVEVKEDGSKIRRVRTADEVVVLPGKRVR